MRIYFATCTLAEPIIKPADRSVQLAAQPMNPWRWFCFVAAFVLCLWGISWGLVWWLADSSQAAGQIGDMFGAINALFSGLALSGVIVAILMQRKELELQREEIRLQREEMARSTKAQEAQQRALIIAAARIPSEVYDPDWDLNHLAEIDRLLNELRNLT